MTNIWTAASEGDLERVKELVQSGKSPPLPLRSLLTSPGW